MQVRITGKRGDITGRRTFDLLKQQPNFGGWINAKSSKSVQESHSRICLLNTMA
jgi:hypothetical protein